MRWSHCGTRESAAPDERHGAIPGRTSRGKSQCSATTARSTTHLGSRSGPRNSAQPLVDESLRKFPADHSGPLVSTIDHEEGAEEIDETCTEIGGDLAKNPLRAAPVRFVNRDRGRDHTRIRSTGRMGSRSALEHDSWWFDTRGPAAVFTPPEPLSAAFPSEEAEEAWKEAGRATGSISRLEHSMLHRREVVQPGAGSGERETAESGATARCAERRPPRGCSGHFPGVRRGVIASVWPLVVDGQQLPGRFS